MSVKPFGRESVVAAIAALKEGKPILVTDDEDRENEGDLIMAAEVCEARTERAPGRAAPRARACALTQPLRSHTRALYTTCTREEGDIAMAAMVHKDHAFTPCAASPRSHARVLS